MNILDSLLNSGDVGAVRQLGAQFGLPPEQTQSALAALVPALMAGFQNNVSREGGLESLASALAGGGHQQYVNDPATLGDPATAADGNGILGHIFGSKDVSRQVAQRASAQTGIDPGILKQMLPVIAALAMGAMSRQSQSAAAGSSSGLPSMLAPMLDQNRDGSVADDLLGLAGRLFSGR
jgi:hypothetical protein